MISGALIARVSDATLYTLNGIELLGIVYLAIALSALRARIARLEGRLQQRDMDADA